MPLPKQLRASFTHPWFDIVRRPLPYPEDRAPRKADWIFRKTLEILPARMNLRHILLPLLWAPIAFGQATPTVKQAPPPGISIPAAEAAELNAALTNLGQQIEALRATRKSQPELLALLPDIEIFHRAVRYALSSGEFFKPSEFTSAKAQLGLGSERARELGDLKASWTEATGPLVRGYRSRIDGSVQPYGLIVPDDWKPRDAKARPLYLWFHGRGDTLTEVSFIAGRLHGKREFAPPNAFELHLYGRYCNASKFAGEVDAFEAMGDVMRHYNIDTNRIAELGFSMGGATAWHMGAHYPGSWAVASAGAGFAETAIYANVFDQKKTPPPQWEQTLWRWYDATDYAANFANFPMIAYSGGIDPQKQSADIMESALAAEGLKLERLIGPNTAHKYEPETKKELSKRIDAYIAQGRDPYPRDIQFVTYALRYNECKWITIDRLGKHWERAEIKAHWGDDGLDVKTTNVTAFTITLPRNRNPNRVMIDDQRVGPGAGESFCRLQGKWQRVPPDFGGGMHKVHGLTGPIDDAFMDSFVFVRPTGNPLNAQTGAWAASELDRAVVEWRRVFRGDAPVKSDTEITDDDIANCNLVLWGDPSSNKLLGRFLAKLPLKWTVDELTLQGHTVDASRNMPIVIFPNPLNPKRYIVLNSSFTFRQGSTTSNSLQTPKLPDWAIVDLRTAPDVKWPGLVAHAGFFDENWQ
ncbi:MAG TPA: prolyl oligopeptidase family serine peptidase [Verrucomicrobiae bacterium]|nr:prolyl oligopeptidase family serine peptidase [Verrucomicrobiae bacterium]